LRVVFAGTPPFAARALEEISAAGHLIPLVLTQPDRACGRGMKLSESAVALAARSLEIPILKPSRLRDEPVRDALTQSHADVMVVAAYGMLLPAAILDIPRLGCVNIHASLLPRWRGAAPIQRALLAGDEETGISIMQMEAGLDTGPVLLERRVDIGPRDTTATLTQRLSALGAQAIVEALRDIDALRPHPQDDGQATYAAKITREDAVIDWEKPSVEIDRQVRASDPFPGAQSELEGETVKIWAASPVDASGKPGEVLQAGPAGLVIACGRGALRLEVLQRPGGRKLATAEFLPGSRFRAGMRLASGSARKSTN
jgi:methionyl-tRNA formyltransferase